MTTTYRVKVKEPIRMFYTAIVSKHTKSTLEKPRIQVGLDKCHISFSTHFGGFDVDNFFADVKSEYPGLNFGVVVFRSEACRFTVTFHGASMYFYNLRSLKYRAEYSTPTIQEPFEENEASTGVADEVSRS